MQESVGKKAVGRRAAGVVLIAALTRHSDRHLTAGSRRISPTDPFGNQFPASSIPGFSHIPSLVTSYSMTNITGLWAASQNYA